MDCSSSPILLLYSKMRKGPSMKTSKLFLAFILSITSTSILADPPSEAKKKEMMQAWQKFATPGAGHKALADMVGKWKYTSKWWESADAKPEQSSGTSTIKWILGGRYL